MFQLKKNITIYLTLICQQLFCSENAAYIQVHFRLYFFMEANNMNPDQAALKGAVWSRSILIAILTT